MKTGNDVKKDSTNDHLDDTYIEVYPRGDVRDLSVTTRIPKKHKTYSKHAVIHGQSPILVRKSYYDKYLLGGMSNKALSESAREERKM